MAYRQREWGPGERRQDPNAPVDTEARYARVRGVGVCRVEKFAPGPERQTKRVAARGKRRSGHWGPVGLVSRNVIRAAVIRYVDLRAFGINNNRRRALAHGNCGGR